MEEKKFDPYQFTGVFLIALILTWMLFNNDNTQETSAVSYTHLRAHET